MNMNMNNHPNNNNNDMAHLNRYHNNSFQYNSMSTRNNSYLLSEPPKEKRI